MGNFRILMTSQKIPIMMISIVYFLLHFHSFRVQLICDLLLAHHIAEQVFHLNSTRRDCRHLILFFIITDPYNFFFRLICSSLWLRLSIQLIAQWVVVWYCVGEEYNIYTYKRRQHTKMSMERREGGESERYSKR